MSPILAVARGVNAASVASQKGPLAGTVCYCEGWCNGQTAALLNSLSEKQLRGTVILRVLPASMIQAGAGPHVLPVHSANSSGCIAHRSGGHNGCSVLFATCCVANTERAVCTQLLHCTGWQPACQVMHGMPNLWQATFAIMRFYTVTPAGGPTGPMVLMLTGSFKDLHEILLTHTVLYCVDIGVTASMFAGLACSSTTALFKGYYLR